MFVKLRLRGSSTVVRIKVEPDGKYLRVSDHKSRQAFVNLISNIVNQTDWPPGGKEKLIKVFQSKMRNPEMRIERRRDGGATVTLLGESGAKFSSADSCVIVK